MKNFKYLVFGIIGFLFIGCGGSSGSRGVSSSYSSPIRTSSNNIYVNQKTGVDTHSIGKIYKTISYALKISQIRDILGNVQIASSIYISGGKYTEENGELFPLILPKGVDFLTYNDNNFSVEIDGFGITENGIKTTLVLMGNNRINNIRVSSNSDTGILSMGGNTRLKFMTIRNNKNAITLLNDSNVTIRNSIIEDNSHSGIELSDNSIVKLINSEIKNSNIGIFVSDSAKIDENSQNSEIINNKQCDFFTDGFNDIQLQGIEWDKNISDFNIETECINGNNIVNAGEGSISYQAIPNRDTLNVSGNEELKQLFISANNRINIVSPKIEELISFTSPKIKYTNNLDSKYMMVTIWKNIPKVSNNKIINPKDIIWYWHTGMKMENSSIGIIDYKDGKNPIDGKLDVEGKDELSTLKKGRSYYVAIWEWDSEEAIQIVSSSGVVMFHVSQ